MNIIIIKGMQSAGKWLLSVRFTVGIAMVHVLAKRARM